MDKMILVSKGIGETTFIFEKDVFNIQTFYDDTQEKDGVMLSVEEAKFFVDFFNLNTGA